MGQRDHDRRSGFASRHESLDIARCGPLIESPLGLSSKPRCALVAGSAQRIGGIWARAGTQTQHPSAKTDSFRHWFNGLV